MENSYVFRYQQTTKIHKHFNYCSFQVHRYLKHKRVRRLKSLGLAWFFISSCADIEPDPLNNISFIIVNWPFSPILVTKNMSHARINIESLVGINPKSTSLAVIILII